ncbi:MAG: hypothetical protein DCC88_00540 [Spirobacillus cienkowskii]|jgi:hypothetical protein|uniref:Tetratricopeptide repeat protein n=1 Tax=Spirobacillus cienkowskii TaxID=495820 RepID=A0A369L014_9BACT|nr:MAG: hypothetical protein DCC88_00540 [Spirobacillus cienkowskii]
MPERFHDFSVAKLEMLSNSFWREINPSAKSCVSLIKLLEVYASKENWEQVINLSSRAVLHLDKIYDRADFYHIWICALKDSFDKDGLVLLGRHLFRMRFFHPVFLSLSLISFSFASKNKIARKIYFYLKKTKGIENRFYFEAIGLFFASQKSIESIKMGLFYLRKVTSEKKCSYFSLRNYLRVLSEKNYVNEMTEVYNVMHERFPFAQEPYLVATLIAIDNTDWKEAIRVLNQIILDNPANSCAILSLCQCYNEIGDYLMTVELLSKNKDTFIDNEYDYNCLLGMTLKKIVDIDFDKNLHQLAIRHLQKSYNLAKFFKFPYYSIEKELNDLKNDKNQKIYDDVEINVINVINEQASEANSLFNDRKVG